jgi:hypothetical protein
VVGGVAYFIAGKSIYKRQRWISTVLALILLWGARLMVWMDRIDLTDLSLREVYSRPLRSLEVKYILIYHQETADCVTL